MSLPRELKVSQNQVKALSKRRSLQPGFYAFLTQGTKQDESKNKGTLGLQQQFFPLKDAADPATKSTPSIRNTIWMPWANDSVQGHKAPNTIGLCHSILRAFEPDEIPDYPRKIDGVLHFEGKELDPTKEEAGREAVTSATLEKLAAAWEEPSSLDNYIVFAEVFDNNGFMNVRKISAELPDGEVLLPVDQWLSEADGDEDEDGNPSPISNGNGNGHAKNGAANGKKAVSPPAGKKAAGGVKKKR